MVRDNGFFEGHDGLKLYYEAWTGSSPKAVIVIAHGLAEHGGRCAPLGEYSSSRGYSVYVMTHRGHGKSQGERGFIKEFDDYVSDLKSFIEKTKQREKTSKVFLIGHSMGGTIALKYALRYPKDLKGVVVSGAGLIVYGSGEDNAKAVSKISPKMKSKIKISPNVLTHDAEIVSKYNEDPLRLRFTTARLRAEVYSAGESILQQAHNLEIPILLLHGGEDTITDPRGSQMLFDNIRIRDKKIIVYPMLYHDLFHELEREKIFEDVLEWVQLI